MTELQVFLTFLINLPCYSKQVHDVSRLSARMRYAVNHDRSDLIVELLHSLLSLDDAIVIGLNSGIFDYSDTILSRYPQSVLPRFLYGLTSRIFDPITGALSDTYDADAVEALLTGLRLLRRAKIKGFSSVSTKKAIEEFLEPQSAPMPDVCELNQTNMRTFWSIILDDFDESLTLGFPGSGVTSDMRFPYVPTLSIVDPLTLPSPIRLPMIRAYQHFLPDNFDVTSDCEFIKSYPYVPYPDRIVTLSVVPKSFKVGRGITITNTSSVIIGATLRETIWKRIKKLGLSRLANVHDQRLSHESLVGNPLDTFCRDIKGGSTCIRVDSQRAYLSSSRTALSLFNFSIPSAVVSNGTITSLVTLTMGDASCSALLTVDMLGFCVLSQCYLMFGYKVLTVQEIQEAIKLLKNEDRVRCVGDDVLGPGRLAAVFDDVVTSQGIKINHRKSSNPCANHQESCGCWVIYDPLKLAYRRIFPFRAPDYTGDLLSDLATLSRSYDRTIKSKYSVEILLAYASRLTHQLEYLENESFTVDRIGSPIGIRPSRRSVRLRPPSRFKVADDVAYTFGCRESLVEPRMSRRPLVERGRIVKCRDITHERSITSVDKSKVHSAFDNSPMSRDACALTASIFAMTVLTSSSARHTMSWVD